MPRRAPRRPWSCADGSFTSQVSAAPAAGARVATFYRGPWSTAFGRWVRGFTVSKLVGQLELAGQGVTRHAVHAWVAGRAVPRYERVAAIVALSGGALSLADVYSQRAIVRRHGGQHDGTHAPPAPR